VSEQHEETAPAGNDDPPAEFVRPRLGLVLAGVITIGAVLDLFCLLLLPFRVATHLVPLAPLLALALNAALASAANRLAADPAPAQALIAVALLLSALAVMKGPGGDVIVTADLSGMYLLFVVAACIGAGFPLFRRRRTA
jgi:hypothetical protein